MTILSLALLSSCSQKHEITVEEYAFQTHQGTFYFMETSFLKSKTSYESKGQENPFESMMASELDSCQKYLALIHANGKDQYGFMVISQERMADEIRDIKK